MRSAAFLLLILLASLTVGCEAQHNTFLPDRTPADRTMFGPRSMRIHPIFTQVKNWSGQPSETGATPPPDGIDALIEFDDQFDDPTKATGKIVFELFSYNRGDPETRGRRVINPWIGSLQTLEEQKAHWNRTSRTYSFQLADPAVSLEKSYVLQATFDSPEGRFFDQLILPAIVPEPTTHPTTKPSANVDVTHTGPATRTVEP